MAVELLDETQRFRGAERVRTALETLMEELDLGGRELTMVLTTDAVIAGLNLRDRGVEGPTDVLSYPTSEPTDHGFPVVDHLGDIVISVDTAAAQAAAAGHDLLTEVGVLAAHGLVHLTGLDHHDAEEWTPFEAAQRRITELLAREEHGS